MGVVGPETVVSKLAKSVSYRYASDGARRWSAWYEFWIESDRYRAHGSGSTSSEALETGWAALEGILEGLASAGVEVVLVIE